MSEKSDEDGDVEAVPGLAVDGDDADSDDRVSGESDDDFVRVKAAPVSGSSLGGWARVDSDNVLRGWVTDRSQRSLRLGVEITIDDEVVAFLTADRLDMKLVELGEGDGRYAFAYAIPQRFRDGEPHLFSVSARDAAFSLRSKVDEFLIEPTDEAPWIEIVSADPGGAHARLHGGQYSKSVRFDLWQDGAPLNVEVEAHWRGATEGRDFYIDFPPSVAKALWRGPVTLAASGMMEAELSCGVIDGFDLALSAQMNEDGTVKLMLLGDSEVGNGFPFDVVFTEGEGGGVVATMPVEFSDHSAWVTLDPSVAAGDLCVTLALGGEALQDAVPVHRRLGRMLANGSMSRWNAEGPAAWTVVEDAEITRGFFAFPDRVSATHQLTGDYVHLELAEPFSIETVLIQQAVSQAAAKGTEVSLSGFLRTSEKASLRLRLVTPDGEERASVALETRRPWSWTLATTALQFEAEVPEGSRVELVLSPGLATTIDVAGLALGSEGFAEQPEPDVTAGLPSNLVVNADLARWPAGVSLDNVVGRGELAEGWFGFNRRSSSPIQAKAIFGDEDGDQVAFAVGVQQVPEYFRLEIRLKPEAKVLTRGKLSFDVGMPPAARRLFMASTVGLPEFAMIERIMVLKRATVTNATGFSLVDTTAAVPGRKVLVTRAYKDYTFDFDITQPKIDSDFDWEIPLDGEEAEEVFDYFISIEFRQPFAVAFRNMSVEPLEGPLYGDDTPYLALEDQAISAQAGEVAGLSSWVGDRVVTVADRRLKAVDRPARTWRWSAMSAGTLEVVVCVYNAIEETLACLASMIGTTEIPHTVRIIDDGSEPSVNQRLREFVSDKPWMILSTNDGNRGYTYSADRGIRDSEAEWVVLLNSDAIVTQGWLEGMLETALTDPSFAFVGPLSNAATFQSVPDLYDAQNKWKTNELPEGWSPEDMADLVYRSSQKAFPTVPLLNGFCTLMRRSVFIEVGGLNVGAFPQGYGEENDLCLRVTAAGYKLAISDHVFIYHSKSASFGSARRTELAKAGGKALRELHPNADLGALTTAFRDTPALVALRAAVRQVYSSSV